MKILFVGPQGSGKGTQAKIIAEKLEVPHISTGDLVRGTTGELKKQVDALINKGNLVPDAMMLEILKQRIERDDCKKGFILDGYPRNVNQAQDLATLFQIDKVFEIAISETESVKRLGGRLSCKKCGSVYNTATGHLPKSEGLCDRCGSSLFKRDDDHDEAIKKRLQTYHVQTKPMLEKYDSVFVNGEQEITAVTTQILETISKESR